jgi:hypothetical protein
MIGCCPQGTNLFVLYIGEMKSTGGKEYCITHFCIIGSYGLQSNRIEAASETFPEDWSGYPYYFFRWDVIHAQII